MAGYPPGSGYPPYGAPPAQPYGATAPYGAPPAAQPYAAAAPYAPVAAPYGAPAPSAPYAPAAPGAPKPGKEHKQQAAAAGGYPGAAGAPGYPGAPGAPGYPGAGGYPGAAAALPAFSPFAALLPSQFPPGTDPNVVACFQAADQDGSGVIDDKELQRALSSYNQSFSLRTVHLLMYLFTGTNVQKIGKSSLRY